MRTLDFCRVLGIGTVAVMLASCGSRSDSGGAVLPPNFADKGLSHHRTFNYTGYEQRFRVPSGVKWINVVAEAAARAVVAAEAPAAAAGACTPLFPSLRARRWQSTSAGEAQE